MKKYSIILAVAISIGFLSYMCEDEEKVINEPSIQFKKGDDYTSSNSPARLDDSLKVGVMAESGNNGNLILFEICRNDETMESINLDKTSLDADIFIVKDTMSTETWKFLVRIKGAGRTRSPSS